MATNVSAPFPDVDMEEKSQIVVDTGNANAKITRMVVHFTQDVPDLETSVESFVPLFTYGHAQ